MWVVGGGGRRGCGLLGGDTAVLAVHRVSNGDDFMVMCDTESV